MITRESELGLEAQADAELLFVAVPAK